MNKIPDPEMIDDENPEWTENDFKNAARMSDLPESLQKKLSAINKRGRPIAEVKKERITIRLSPEVTDYFRATGKGWQTRMDKVLQEYIANH